VTDRIGNNDDRKLSQVYDLADTLLYGTASAEGARLLDKLLCTDAEARRHYIEFMHDCATFRRWSRTLPPVDGAEVGGDKDRATDDGKDECGTTKDELPAGPPAAATFPSLCLSSFSTPHLNRVAFCYGITVLILGVGILGAATWRSRNSRPIAAQSTNFASVTVLGTSQRPATAKITGMKNCRWASPHAEIEVARGEIALVSGELELTYRSGVKVLIQGPAVYRLETENGGFVQVGKVTVFGEMEGKRPMATDKETQDHQAGAITEPFFLRTPICCMTNRDAEFWVLVDQSGETVAFIVHGLAYVTYDKQCLAYHYDGEDPVLTFTPQPKTRRPVHDSGEKLGLSGGKGITVQPN
jgi:hypothetical protein